MKAKKRSVTLSVDNQSTNNFVKADRDKISQVLINLMKTPLSTAMKVAIPKYAFLKWAKTY